jgi:hypothetical protein
MASPRKFLSEKREQYTSNWHFDRTLLHCIVAKFKRVCRWSEPQSMAQVYRSACPGSGFGGLHAIMGAQRLEAFLRHNAHGKLG